MEETKIMEEYLNKMKINPKASESQNIALYEYTWYVQFTKLMI